VASNICQTLALVVNFVVPFTVIPLTQFLSSPAKTGPYRLSKGTKAACWAASAVEGGVSTTGTRTLIGA